MVNGREFWINIQFYPFNSSIEFFENEKQEIKDAAEKNSEPINAEIVNEE